MIPVSSVSRKHMKKTWLYQLSCNRESVMTPAYQEQRTQPRRRPSWQQRPSREVFQGKGVSFWLWKPHWSVDPIIVSSVDGVGVLSDLIDKGRFATCAAFIRSYDFSAKPTITCPQAPSKLCSQKISSSGITTQDVDQLQADVGRCRWERKSQHGLGGS